ncbi:NUDIX hydrolase [Zhengella mangrovi]|uniref:NUDIX hydrolase n=1 Tax=Zhengella mangrovi TaxID=1982044 RepID=A0A2G1QKT4_9HYPH|nr:NUDIX hydrolase [Zhengella mangrovi]PHP65818.1 NUDIX hydrolase [Zhengella mangrovi]
MITNQTRIRMLEGVRRVLGGPEAALQSAALPWRKSGKEIEILLITSRGTGRWVLPKGWPEKGETMSESAAREAAEEAGVEGPADEDKTGVYFYDKELRNGVLRRCEVHVFALRVRKLAKDWPESDQRQRKWFPVAKAASLVDEPDLGELIAGFGGKPAKSQG